MRKIEGHAQTKDEVEIEYDLQSAHNSQKKYWADMVEEEGKELLSGRTSLGYYDGAEGEEYHNENLNSNITCQSPCPQRQIKGLSFKFGSFDLKDGYGEPGAGIPVSSRNPEVQCSLFSDQHQKPESKDYFHSSPFANKALDFGCNFVHSGRDSVYRENKEPNGNQRIWRFGSFEYLGSILELNRVDGSQ